MLKFIMARWRLFLALVTVVAVYPLLPTALAPRTRLLCAWDMAILEFLVLTGWLFATVGPTRIAHNAEAQEEGEWTIFVIIVAVVVASFVAIFGEFTSTKDLHGAVKDMHIALVAVTLMASWLMMQACFCYRYAHEYYTATHDDGKPDGGLDFPKEDCPDYMDFTYFAIVLGMTFQVSDVQITSRKFRRLATLHGLLSFLFNTVIVALTVNIGASLM